MNSSVTVKKRALPARIRPIAPAGDPEPVATGGARGGSANANPVRTLRTFRIFRNAGVVRSLRVVRANAKPLRSLQTFRIFRNAPDAPVRGAVFQEGAR